MTSEGRHYNPSQPRVPAGHARGGQWTSGEYGPRSEERSSPFRHRRDETGREPWASQVESYNSDGTVKEDLLFNRDGSAVRSQYAPTNDLGWDRRHTVRLPDGTIIEVEDADGVQRIYDANGILISARRWGENGPEDLPIVLARNNFSRPQNPRRAVGEALLRIVEQLLRRSRRENGVVVLEYPGSEYQRGESPGHPRYVGYLTKQQVSQVCQKYPDVMTLLTLASEKVRREHPNLSASQFGTAVHKLVSDDVNGRNDPTFIAERSYRKSLDAYADSMIERVREQQVGARRPSNKEDDPYYSELHTLRVDVMEDLGDGTICVYDIKTGDRTLSSRRMDEIALAVAEKFPHHKRFVVIEARLDPR